MNYGKELMVKKIGMVILKETLVQIMISILLVFVTAFVVLKMSPAESVIRGMILSIYAIASFVGGNILGGVMEKRKFLWGMLAGAIYIGLIFLIAFCTKGSMMQGSVGLVKGIAVCLGCGMLGGMFG